MADSVLLAVRYDREEDLYDEIEMSYNTVWTDLEAMVSDTEALFSALTLPWSSMSCVVFILIGEFDA